MRLAREKGFLETIFNAVREGVIVTDVHGRISYLNDAACELFGFDRERVMGELLAEQVKGVELGRAGLLRDGRDAGHGDLLPAKPVFEFLCRPVEP